jgi:ribonuclease HII
MSFGAASWGGSVLKNPEEKDAADLRAMERQLHDQGIALVCGVDEAGRGPLAGPVCAAAVILPEQWELPGLNDSKKLTEKKREALFTLIQQQAVAYGIAFATVEEIEDRNILSAALLAMNRAIEQLSPAPTLALIDGNTTRDIRVPAQSIVGGDGKCACIAAASVLAKVTRDRYMVEMAQQYPQYGFEKHKGYGTKAHYAALETYGPCPIHRMSFLKKFYAQR